MNLTEFHEFFAHCVGKWQTERTYHYLTTGEVERSYTEFQVNPLTPELKIKVLKDNQYDLSLVPDLSILPGFNLIFNTVSEKGERVAQDLNLLFVPHSETSTHITGDYLRDRAYEEARPIISHFTFDRRTNELLMTTNYTQIVSVDSITLINPDLRLRKIINYYRPLPTQPLTEVVLVGFGVEQKVK